jgi:acylpyruvate hydrolase
MRFATIRTESGTRAARVEGDELVALPFDDVGQLIASGPGWAEHAGEGNGNGTRVPLADADFAPLTPSPEKVICVGLNYHDHAVEADLQIPDVPTIFPKFARSLIGPTDDIVMPTVSDAVDWEVELGVVIGQPARHVSADEAEATIAGYTIVNDVSARDWQLQTSQWMPGKIFEGFTPVGPFLVTPDEVDHARSLSMRLTVDGEVMQDSSTDQMVFKPRDIIAYISQIITLVPGDLIATGTPAGVGHVRDPKIYLTEGKVVETTIEGLGTQTNRCVPNDNGR